MELLSLSLSLESNITLIRKLLIKLIKILVGMIVIS